jgi:catechol 2,3-dioxygenase-like lactoylglutathione lyase family enzyme
MLGSADLIAFVPTRDPAKARKFYEETLGLEFISEDPFALVSIFADPIRRGNRILHERLK